jgi:hypothetical protein
MLTIAVHIGEMLYLKFPLLEKGGEEGVDLFLIVSGFLGFARNDILSYQISFDLLLQNPIVKISQIFYFTFQNLDESSALSPL